MSKHSFINWHRMLVLFIKLTVSLVNVKIFEEYLGIFSGVDMIKKENNCVYQKVFDFLIYK